MSCVSMAYYMPEAESKRRVSIPVETLRQIQQSCMEHDDDMRWLVALISDTGMRLAEAADCSAAIRGCGAVPAAERNGQSEGVLSNSLEKRWSCN